MGHELVRQLYDQIAGMPCINPLSDPNVHLNLSWIHIVSPIGVRCALKEWLRVVPYTKIVAFGDDVYHPEMVYAHQKIARQNVAIVLAELIEDGTITEEVALDVARALFYDNPRALYGGNGLRKRS